MYRIFALLIDYASTLRHDSDIYVTKENIYMYMCVCGGAYKLTHSIIPARLSVCKPYIQLNRSSSRGGWSSPMPLYSRWYRAARSDSGSPWFNEKLSGLYIRGHRGVLVMQNSRTNWIPPGDTSLSFMELIPTRQENVWRDVRGLRSPRSRRWRSLPGCAIVEKQAEIVNT